MPGPQTPNKIAIKKNLPVRSLSPPTRDTDHVWRPQPVNDVPFAVTHFCGAIINRHSSIQQNNAMGRLQLKVDRCSNKLAGLEKQLRVKCGPACQNAMPRALMHSPVPPPAATGKTHSEMAILSHKLRDLLGAPHSPRRQHEVVTQRTGSPRNVDALLSRLDGLVAEMATIEARWGQVDYESVSVCSDDEPQSLDEEIRFTKPRAPLPWKPQQDEDLADRPCGKICLDLPNESVTRLDEGRLAPRDSFRCFGVPMRLLHVDWLSGDLVSVLCSVSECDIIPV